MAPLKGKMEKISINDYYIHYKDLFYLLEFAKEKNENEDEKWKISLFLRQVIIKACFALEALINQILIQFSIFKDKKELFEHFEKLSTLNKLIGVHTICKTIENPILKNDEILYAQIKELFKLRNSWAHGKGETRIPVMQDGTMDWMDPEGNDLGTFPKIKVPKGIEVKEATRIPINPFELNIDHGETCLRIVKEVEKRIINAFNISLEEDLHSLSLFNENGDKIGVSPIKFTWGAYTPEE